MAYGTINAGAITPGSGATLTISETIALGTVASGVIGADVTGGAGLTGRSFFAYKSGNSNQSTSSGAWVQVTWGGIIQSHSSVSGNAFTAVAADAGKWAFFARTGHYTGSNDLKTPTTAIYKDGAVVAAGYNLLYGSAGDANLRHYTSSTFTVIDISNGDVITHYAWTTATSPQIVAGNNDVHAYLSTSMIGIKL
tara:strand:- start:394 stop:978 length:585 start_codon:yes stop_codon:yes gene_type:complete